MTPFDPKAQFLLRHRVFHTNYRAVSEPCFRNGDFFDPRDLLLVKCEMLRKVRVEGCSVAQATRAFALSRTSYYEALHAWQSHGLHGLLPNRPGPRGPHKVTEEVLDFLRTLQSERGSVDASQLAGELRVRHALSVHPRTIEKALSRRQKGG